MEVKLRCGAHAPVFTSRGTSVGGVRLGSILLPELEAQFRSPLFWPRSVAVKQRSCSFWSRLVCTLLCAAPRYWLALGFVRGTEPALPDLSAAAR